MERIKKALEKARQERELIRGGAVLNWEAAAEAHRAGAKLEYRQTTEVPRERLRESRIIAGMEQGALLDTYKVLHTKVLQRLQDNAWRTVAVTSPGPGEGKTLTAINLAVSLAMEVHLSVLLVDAHLRRPALHQVLGLEAEPGLSEHLTAGLPWEELLIHPGIGNLGVLPGGRAIANSSEMLASPQMARLVHELKARDAARIVLFDMPPVLAMADALAFSRQVDALLWVVEEGRTQAEDLTRALGMLKDTPLLGTVLNKALRRHELH
jgi:protein-tyrosine kinase